ncbi:Iridoid oxidase [Camellia lanceoleosa]|uniref:Iridoid oxidase n=1 Tax=Camellia lanceoleosa TaxID=1840588 RepID=A0ACC0G6L8_9ERIC|nr:Iridoid oxidase [Camellia lanceoleosa]
MEWVSSPPWFTPLTLLLLPFLFIFFKYALPGPNKPRPPGPPGWPVFGNMFDLGPMPHQTLHKLRPKYGPVLWLQLGSMNTIAVQSAIAAAELFKNHDVPFSDRKVPHALTAFDFSDGTIALGNYGGYWRTMGRLCSMEFLVTRRINETPSVRRRCVDNMVRWVDEAAAVAVGVQLSRFLFLMSFNLVGNLMLSKDVLDPESEEGFEFSDSMSKVMCLAAMPNLADSFPILKWVDPQGIKRSMKRELEKPMKIAARFVEERVLERESGRKEKSKKDFLDLLLDYEGDGREDPHKISEKNVKIIILVMLVNVWAIGRDPDCWDDLLSFKPERFIGSSIEYEGQHHELIQFGTGRRICVGFTLAHRVVHFGLATLLQAFDWELPSNFTTENLDMSERMGLNLRKLVPLKAIPKRRKVCG